jgi:hypothetical protein
MMGPGARVQGFSEGSLHMYLFHSEKKEKKNCCLHMSVNNTDIQNFHFLRLAEMKCANSYVK